MQLNFHLLRYKFSRPQPSRRATHGPGVFKKEPKGLVSSYLTVNSTRLPNGWRQHWGTGAPGVLCGQKLHRQCIHPKNIPEVNCTRSPVNWVKLPGNVILGAFPEGRSHFSNFFAATEQDSTFCSWVDIERSTEPARCKTCCTIKKP